MRRHNYDIIIFLVLATNQGCCLQNLKMWSEPRQDKYFQGLDSLRQKKVSIKHPRRDQKVENFIYGNRVETRDPEVKRSHEHNRDETKRSRDVT